MTKARKTTQEERVIIAKECLATDRDYGEIAEKYQVTYQQVYAWTNKFAELGISGVEDRRGKRISQQEPRTEEERLKIKRKINVSHSSLKRYIGKPRIRVAGVSGMT
ncbi:helix-turn-helix domain-containing protein [Pectinatus frisingensis]|uniref:helix-turn-helix domain-containing protein n=1 Tax=Pectinatus frisingensis TaxID=865 RepID=UPI0018C4B356|nr:helix-turn-helix domain-containing protein [Pectinatus frisingensis]